ncbi:MAG: hypothetical protein KF799_09865 [Bdellovibrionales bacterium]|nr:hypothetical protein [Bdellovibrionales bacterium]
MFTKNILALVLLGVAVLLTACQGENTFRRPSNPYSEYQHVYDDSLAYDVNNRPKPQVANPTPYIQTPACTEPFKMTIEGSKDGGKSVEFVQNKQKSITITVESRIEADRQWDVRPMVSPCENCFKTVSKTQDKAEYKFTWKPGKIGKFQDQFLVLRYDYLMDTRCTNASPNQQIALIITDGKVQEPSVAFSEIKSEGLKFGDSFKFQIKISDTEGSVEKAPDVAAITYMIDGKKISSKAQAPVDCEKNGELLETPGEAPTWVFQCAFESRLIGLTAAQIKKLSGSGKTVVASFKVKAQSNASSLVGSASAEVPVLFEKTGAVAKAQGE